jgi:hypothetical protein
MVDIEEEVDVSQPFSQQDLDEANRYDPSIDYRKEMLDRYKDVEVEDRDGCDDFVHEKDRVALVRFISAMIKKEHPYFPSNMESLLVKKMYQDTIMNMDRDEYLAEKEAESKLSSVDKILKVIEEEDNVDYAMKALK